MDLRRLAGVANKLDSLGLTKEADVLDRYLTKVALTSEGFDLPDVDLDSLPDSPEEVAAYKANRPQPMMGSITYSPDSKPMRGGLQMVAPGKKELYVATPATGSDAPSMPATPTSSQLKDIEYRRQIAQGMGKSVWKSQDLIKEYNFNFPLTVGKVGNIAKIQKALNDAGFSVGEADGYWGGKTNNAFRDAVHAFVMNQPDVSSLEKIFEVAINILNGVPPTMPFTLEMVISMCEHLKSLRAKGVSVSSGTAITDYVGSKGGGRFDPQLVGGDSKLTSTKAGEPVAGTSPKK